MTEQKLVSGQQPITRDVGDRTCIFSRGDRATGGVQRSSIRTSSPHETTW